jgi:hypothetical protein
MGLARLAAIARVPCGPYRAPPPTRLHGVPAGTLRWAETGRGGGIARERTSTRRLAFGGVGGCDRV